MTASTKHTIGGVSDMAIQADEDRAAALEAAGYAPGDTPEPCTVLAIRFGCTCRIPLASAYDTDPPEPKISRDCVLHGSPRDPDFERDAARDEATA